MFSFFKKKPVEPVASSDALTSHDADNAVQRTETRDRSAPAVGEGVSPSATSTAPLGTVEGSETNPINAAWQTPDTALGGRAHVPANTAPELPGTVDSRPTQATPASATPATSTTSTVRNWLRKPFMRASDPAPIPSVQVELGPLRESVAPLTPAHGVQPPGRENPAEVQTPAPPNLESPPFPLESAGTGSAALPQPPLAPAKTEPDAQLSSPLVSPSEHLVPRAHMPTAPRSGWMDRLRGGLRKTGSSITTVFTGTRIDEALYEELEDALLMADTGVKATQHLLTDLKRRVKETRTTEPAAVRVLLADVLTDLLHPLEKSLVVGEFTPTVIMVAGVNGAGKTTSIGKLTAHLAQAGGSVLLAAADTFRAAAREQLGVWADRNTVEIISQEGGDPAAVSYDAVTAGRARRKDVVLIDTAGRLPTQLHLMEELRKIKRTVAKAGNAPGHPGMGQPPHEVLLVIDGNTGQNALAQVRAFDDALQLTGLIVTKLDGTAKGGVLAAIAQERPIPVYFIGVGEKLEDLETFSAREFAQALLS